jgi:tetrapyrrole methylase family protein / MazG family protein
MSFLDVAWARLGVDPVEAGVRLVDGHEFAPPRPASAARCSSPTPTPTGCCRTSSSPSTAPPATSRSRSCTRSAPRTNASSRPRGPTSTAPSTADHLTSLWIPALAAPVGAEYVRFHQLTRTLREQCPWDIEQTHDSLVPHLLEETYEVVDAIHGLDPDDPTTDEHLIEELGDLLYQIEFHATIAEQEGRFTIADVASGIHDKLVRRHPHVFGDLAGTDLDTDQVLSNWDDIKRAEKGRTSVFDGIPRSMPALAYAAKVGAKASKVGFDWPDVSGAFPKIAEETAELDATILDARSGRRPPAPAPRSAEELGDLLFAVVNVARHLRIDPELALRAATDKFRVRFEGVERLATERSIDLRDADLATLDALWDEVKTR